MDACSSVHAHKTHKSALWTKRRSDREREDGKNDEKEWYDLIMPVSFQWAFAAPDWRWCTDCESGIAQTVWWNWNERGDERGHFSPCPGTTGNICRHMRRIDALSVAAIRNTQTMRPFRVSLSVLMHFRARHYLQATVWHPQAITKIWNLKNASSQHLCVSVRLEDKKCNLHSLYPHQYTPKYELLCKSICTKHLFCKIQRKEVMNLMINTYETI